MRRRDEWIIGLIMLMIFPAVIVLVLWLAPRWPLW